MVLNSQITLIKMFTFNALKRKYGGARSPASLAISSVWKPYIMQNCKADDLGTGFEIAEGYWIWHGLEANFQINIGQGGLF